MPQSKPHRPDEPVAVPRVVLCPYCGELSRDPARCERCRGHFDPLSRQATQNSMGPWFIRDDDNPFRPGCSFEVLKGMAERKKIGLDTVIRGPTTNQFWTPARRTPGVANLMGVCHNCGCRVGAQDVACLSCGATFAYHADRQHLGLTEVRLLPGQAPPEAVAAAASAAAGPSVTGSSGPSRWESEVRPEPAVEGAGPAERHARGRVPVWIWVVAALAVAGAVTAAAWVMNAIPGLPSPTYRPAGPDSDERDRSVNSDSRETKPESPIDDGPPDREGTRGMDEVSKEAPEEAPTGAVSPDAAAGNEGPIEEALRQLYLGTEESWREAATLARLTDRADFVREAADRLARLGPLRRLP